MFSDLETVDQQSDQSQCSNVEAWKMLDSIGPESRGIGICAESGASRSLSMQKRRSERRVRVELDVVHG